MDQKESLALFAKGRDAWNAWAEKRLSDRAALKAAGTWVESDWHSAAVAEFSGHSFQHRANFSNFVFPGSARFKGTTFRSGASFEKTVFSEDVQFSRGAVYGDAVFKGAAFKGRAEFDETTFKNTAQFGRATFTADAEFDRTAFTGEAEFYMVAFAGDASFDDASFTGEALFERATFTGRAGFCGVTFTGDVEFKEATFTGPTGFDGVIFRGKAVFYMATFKGDTGFQQAIFEEFTAFDRTKFEHSPNFRAIEAKSLFSLTGATFLAVPDFIQAHFAEAPRLDDSHIEQQRKWPITPTRIKDTVKSNPRLAARWRALKRLAIQGHDHAREQAFFKGELKARRWSEDKPWQAVFWFGVFYQVLSDFGRSIWRPLMWWGVSVLGFAGLYLGQHSGQTEGPWLTIRWMFQSLTGSNGDVPPQMCIAGPGEPWVAALNLSVQKGLLLPGLVPINKLNQIYACLYGIHPIDGAKPGQLPASFSPVIPDGVTALGFLQQPLSAVLIFLLLLAIRNHFRIK